MVQFNLDTWFRFSHVLSTLTETAASPKGRMESWNETLERSFKELKHMVSAKTLSSYPDQKIPFTVHTDASDQQVVAVISHNNKPIAFF